MLKKIIGTTGSRAMIALMNVLIVFMNARYLGATGLGLVALIILGITIILLVNNILGGTSLVYLVPREDNFKLLVPGYLWAILVMILFWGVFCFVDLVPKEYHNHVLLLSFLFSMAQVNLNLLLGKEKIRVYNVITFLQYLAQLLYLLVFFILLKTRDVMTVVQSLYCSYGFVFLASLLVVMGFVKRSDLRGLMGVVKQIFSLGYLIQLAYICQMLNYRLSYYIIRYFAGGAALGMFSFGNQLAEGTWIIGKSIATVQYARISNTTDMDYARRLSLGLLKVTFMATLALVMLILLLPGKVYMIFGKDFTGTRIIVASLGIGILANAVSMMLSHYFAGLGKPRYNLFGSLLGLMVTLSLGFWLIPRYGILGAGITASCSYLSALIFQFIIFFRMSKARPVDLLIRKEDYRLLVQEMRNLLKREL